MSARASDFSRDALEASDEAPTLSAESLRELEFDGLAEVYDIAAEAWRTHGRAGNTEQAERWRAIARAVTHEAAAREEAENNNSSSGRGRRLRGRQDRLREQLREAVAEREA